MKQFRADMLLFIAAVIWGTAFVAQSAGMKYIGPYLFGSARFALGGLVLLIPAFFFRRLKTGLSTLLVSGGVTGTVLFMAASLQQTGIQYTTVGKAGFVTCLYVVIVPLIGMFTGCKPGKSSIAGSVVAVAGLYLLCVRDNFSVEYGDVLELAGAFAWSAHILLIDYYVKTNDALQLACVQFFVCAAWSLPAALLLERVETTGLAAAIQTIAYAGILSVGIAYTLQVVAQKNTQPVHAAIILSLETVFAALSGWLFLGEQLSDKEMAGCILMLTGMLISQLGPFIKTGKNIFVHRNTGGS